MLFDIDVDTGVARAKEREAGVHGKDESRYERMGAIFHKNVRRGFLETAKKESNHYAVIDADATINENHVAVVSSLNFHLRCKVEPLSVDTQKTALSRKH